MFSSAFGDRLLKFSQASYKIAAGDVEPGRKMDTEAAARQKRAENAGRWALSETVPHLELSE